MTWYLHPGETPSDPPYWSPVPPPTPRLPIVTTPPVVTPIMPIVPAPAPVPPPTPRLPIVTTPPVVTPIMPIVPAPAPLPPPAPAPLPAVSPGTRDLNPGFDDPLGPGGATPRTLPAAPAPAAPAPAPSTQPPPIDPNAPELPPGAIRLRDGTIWQPTVDQQRLDADIKRDAAELKRKQDEFAIEQTRLRDLAAQEQAYRDRGQAQEADRIAIERQRAEAEIAWRQNDVAQRQAELDEKKRQFDASLPLEVAAITGTYRGEETLTARNTRLDREQRDRAQYNDVAKALLSTAAGLRGPEDYYQYQTYLAGGRSLIDQLQSGQAAPAFGAPSQPSKPASLAVLLAQLGITNLPGQSQVAGQPQAAGQPAASQAAGAKSTPARPGQQAIATSESAQSGQPGGARALPVAGQPAAATADPDLYPLPHQINPAQWDAMNPTAKALLRSAVAAGRTQGGAYDPQDYEHQINATRPQGQVARRTTYQYAPVTGAY